MLESRLNRWISSIVATATLAAPTVAYAERLPTYLNESTSIESRYHLLDSSLSNASLGISGMEEIAQQEPCPPQLYYLPECQEQLKQQQSAPTYVPPNQQPSPQPTPQPAYVPQPSPQPTYQPSYSAPPEKEDDDTLDWVLIGGGAVMGTIGMLVVDPGKCTVNESGYDECRKKFITSVGLELVGAAMIVIGVIGAVKD